MERIKLNVGGVHFETTKNTLQHSGYFSALLNNWNHEIVKNNSSEPYFIDRSGIIFEHVLAYLRDPEYLYPVEYLNELEFYCIDKPNNIKEYIDKEKFIELKKEC